MIKYDDTIEQTLNLVNCPLTFHLVDKKESKRIVPEEDIEDIVEEFNDMDDANNIGYYEHSKINIYINSEHKISIICEQIRFDDEEWFDDTSEIINCIRGDVFDKLVRYINTHDNLTIYIYQIFGTTSDFVIYTDTYVANFVQFLEEILGTEISTPYKYLIYNNGIMEKFI